MQQKIESDKTSKTSNVKKNYLFKRQDTRFDFCTNFIELWPMCGWGGGNKYVTVTRFGDFLLNWATFEGHYFAVNRVIFRIIVAFLAKVWQLNQVPEMGRKLPSMLKYLGIFEKLGNFSIWSHCKAKTERRMRFGGRGGVLPNRESRKLESRFRPMGRRLSDHVISSRPMRSSRSESCEAFDCEGGWMKREGGASDVDVQCSRD